MPGVQGPQKKLGLTLQRIHGRGEMPQYGGHCLIGREGTNQVHITLMVVLVVVYRPAFLGRKESTDITSYNMM